MRRLRAAGRLGKDEKVRVDLVIEKVGDQWCLFTKDRSRKLGCHPSKEQAEAQERAVQAQTGRARAGDVVALGRSILMLGADTVIEQMGCEGVLSHWDSWGGFEGCVSAMTGQVDDVEAFCGAFDHAAQQCGAEAPSGASKKGQHMGLFFDSRISTDAAEILEDGSARLDVRLAPLSDTSFQHGKTEFSLSSDEVDQAIANFNKRGAPVPMTIGHYPSAERQKQPAVAWIEKLYRAALDGQTYLMATIRYLAKTWAAIQSDEYKFLSMEFWPQDLDQHGTEIGMNVDGAALTNYPFFPLRFDQARGGSVLWLARFGAGGSTMSEKKKQDLRAGTEIRQVGSEWFIFNTAGEKLGKAHASKELAEAALSDLVGLAGKMGLVRPEAGDQVQLGKDELEQLRKDSAELKELKKTPAPKPGEGKSAEVIALEKKVKDLEDKDAAGEKRETARRIRSAVATLTEKHHVHLRLGDHDLETDDGALNFLKTKPYGVESVEGLEKLAKDVESSAHLPHVRLGGEKQSGSNGATGDPDLGTKEGRGEAVRRKVVALRKEFPGEELEDTLRKRGQTIEQYARQELSTEHRGVDWFKD